MDIKLDFDFQPTEQMKTILKEAGKQFVAGATSAAAVSLLGQLITNGIFAPKTTTITVDGNIPAELLTISGKDGPCAYYISNKKSKVNLVPAAVLAVSALIVAAILNADEKESNTHVV